MTRWQIKGLQDIVNRLKAEHLLLKKRKKDRKEKGETMTKTCVHTPREGTERKKDGDERSEVTGSGRGLPLKGTRDQKE